MKTIRFIFNHTPLFFAVLMAFSAGVMFQRRSENDAIVLPFVLISSFVWGISYRARTLSIPDNSP